MGERKLCYGCMERTEFSGGVCPHCGYYDQSPSDPSFIQPGTHLHDRYIVGVVQSVNGEGVTYLAYDQSIGCKVLLREYMPQNLCTRVTGSPVIRVIPARLAQYKALMAEFTELHKSLARLRGQVHIYTVVDLFAENNTTYVVDEYVESIRFVDYLKENAGELTWGQLSHMLPPLMTTLSLLHNSGVVHRAISPDTIYVTNKGEFILSAFSIAAVRTANTELTCEIYNGYAAPEQYAANERQGTWTDVYAVCAVIYRVLTGSMPPSAISRLENDNLVAPSVLNPNVPRHVSNVIMRGMHLNSEERIQTVTQLVTNLFDEHAAEDEIPLGGYDFSQNDYADDYPQEDYPSYEETEYPDYDTGYSDDYAYDTYGEDGYDDGREKAGAIDRLKVPIIVGIVLLLVLLICVFVFAGDWMGGNDNSSISSTSDTSMQVTGVSDDNAEATQEATEATTAPAGDSIMPNLLGKNYENQREQYASWITFDVEEVFDDTYAAGQICWQEYDAGETFDSSKPVRIQVCIGPATVEIPSYYGYGISSYSSELDALHISYTTQSQTTSSYSNGSVIGILVTRNGQEVDVDAGDQINLNDNYQVVVYYAYNPEPETTEPPTTEAPTEAPTEAATQAPTQAPTEAPAGGQPAPQDNIGDPVQGE